MAKVARCRETPPKRRRRLEIEPRGSATPRRCARQGEDRLKSLIRILVVLVVLAVAAFGYVFWTNLTPGEKHHIVDKARSGDVAGFADSVKFKANEELERQKRVAREAAGGVVHDVADQVVDEAAEQLHQQVGDLARRAKKTLEPPATDAGAVRP